MSQSNQILNHLKTKPITPIQALQLYSCFRLAARILDLRDEGYKIRTDRIKKNGKQFAQYTLENRR